MHRAQAKAVESQVETVIATRVHCLGGRQRGASSKALPSAVTAAPSEIAVRLAFALIAVVAAAAAVVTIPAVAVVALALADAAVVAGIAVVAVVAAAAAEAGGAMRRQVRLMMVSLATCLQGCLQVTSQITCWTLHAAEQLAATLWCRHAHA